VSNDKDKMNTLGQNSNQNKAQTPAVNPFAKALAEMENHAYGPQTNQNNNSESNILSNALAKTGNSAFNNQLDSVNTPGNFQNNSIFEQQRQQQELKEKQKKEALRKKLHDQVNPIDQIKVYEAQELKVKKEIEEIRDQLKLLILDVKKFHKEVEVTLMTEIAEPGREGKYYVSFFQQLRSLIMLMRQRVQSARTWAQQSQSYNKKKKKKKGPGAMFGAQETKAVHDMMHHERSTAFNAG
jgi:hypothetical protein